VRGRLHDRRPELVRDPPAAGRPVTLVWVKRVWRCKGPLRGKQTWTETSEAIRPRAAWTERARAEVPAGRRAGQTVAAVAEEFGVGGGTVMAVVRDYGRRLVADPARLDAVHTLGVDETAFLAATPTSGTAFATGIVALNGRPRLLDVVEGRSEKALASPSRSSPSNTGERTVVAQTTLPASATSPGSSPHRPVRRPASATAARVERDHGPTRSSPAPGFLDGGLHRLLDLVGVLCHGHHDEPRRPEHGRGRNTLTRLFHATA
jgi:hypothetical protein